MRSTVERKGELDLIFMGQSIVEGLPSGALDRAEQREGKDERRKEEVREQCWSRESNPAVAPSIALARTARNLAYQHVDVVLLVVSIYRPKHHSNTTKLEPAG